MKILRIFAIILLIFGSILLFFGIALSAMNVYNALFGPGSIGIIGGADWSTAWLIFRTRALERYGALMLTGFMTTIVSTVLLIVGRKSRKKK